MSQFKKNILDCTLRDGGYYTNWTFSKKLVARYLKSIKRSKINYVEIGFKFFNKKKEYTGVFANVNEDLIGWANSISKNNYGLMINASDFKNLSELKIKQKIYNAFKNSKYSNLKFVRIASHTYEAEVSRTLAKYLKKLGYKVFVNLMQISTVEIKTLEKYYFTIEKYCDIFYVADSLGSLRDKKQILKICKFLKTIKKPFGIHAHNNRGLALQNTILFSKLGARWLDSTILGMGRGPGNVDTIKLIEKLNNKKVIGFSKTKKDFILLKKKFNWGKNIYYELASQNNIHPTYIQEILSYKNVEKKMILNFIQCLSKLETHSYSKDVMEKAISSVNDKKQNLQKINKKTDVLILGSAKSLSSEHFIEVVNFIKKKKPLVLSLNFNKELLEQYIDFFVVSHFNRIFLNNKNIKKNINKVIMPFVPNIEKKYSKKLIVYPLMVKKGYFKVFKNNCIIPNMLSFSYAMSIARLAEAKNIYLAGFEGYTNYEDMSKNVEMFDTIEIIKKSKKININSITPTIYPVKCISSTQIL